MSAPPPISRIVQEQGLASLIRRGFLIVVFGFGGVLAWLVLADLSSAVVAGGQVVVSGDVKKVQHPAGGIVETIFVQNGSRVKAGDVLIRLDETMVRATLAQVESQLAQLTGRSARLIAERDNAPQLALPRDFAALNPEAASIAEGEARLLRESRLERAQTLSQLQARGGQIGREIEGARAQLDAKKRELGFIATELSGIRKLYEKQLTPITRLSALQRETARIEGETGALLAGIARNEGQIAEIKIQMLNIEQKVKTDAIKELREIEGNIAQLNERRVAARDALLRIEIRAPVAGIVHELSQHTPGGVIATGEVLMQIVPEGETLSVEVRLSPADIDQVRLGQKAILRFTAFNQRTTPEVSGQVSRIAPDATREAQTNTVYYTARISLPLVELEKLNGLALVPGMPVETFIQAGERSAMSYLFKPLVDGMHRAGRER